MNVYAAGLGQIGGPGLGPFAQPGRSGAADLVKLISGGIGVITIGAAVWFMIQLFVGGLNWLASGGEKTKLNEARDRITNAFVGLIVVVASWGIIALMGQFLGGFEILNLEALLGKIRL